MSETERAPSPGLLSALSYRDFRLYWAGLGISNVGDWIQNIAGGWLIARLTDSAAVVGGVTSAVMVPIMGLMLLGGVLADRHERRKILLTTQSILCLMALAGTAVVAFGQVTLPLVLLWFLVLGAVLAFNAPSEHALIAQLVPPSHLSAAVGLHGATFSTSQLVGTALAAALLGMGTLPWLFFANAMSFLPLIVILLVIRPRPTPAPSPQSTEDGTFREGLRYAWGHRQLRALLGANALLALLIHPFYKVFLPIFVKTTLGGSERELGHILLGAAVGAFLGSLTLARVAPRARGPALIFTNGLIALELVGLALSDTPWTATLHTSLLAFGVALSYGLTHTLLQLTAPDRFRGRVISFSEFLQMGAPPLAAIGLGLLADWLQMPLTMSLAAVVFFLPATAWLASARLSELSLLPPKGAALSPGGQAS